MDYYQLLLVISGNVPILSSKHSLSLSIWSEFMLYHSVTKPSQNLVDCQQLVRHLKPMAIIHKPSNLFAKKMVDFKVGYRGSFYKSNICHEIGYRESIALCKKYFWHSEMWLYLCKMNRNIKVSYSALQRKCSFLVRCFHLGYCKGNWLLIYRGEP